tara:strand:- start:6632 stop:7429 length:798 start_codon:yes stop_codon:yes gene_type:complete
MKKYETIGSVTWSREDLIGSLQEFLRVYDKRPIRSNFGGMSSSHMFVTWFLCKRLNPKHIIESGIWMGQSSWLLETACPNAEIVSIDPELHLRKYISPNISYTVTDFTDINWDSINKDETLCFFDDHYGVDRIKQAAQRGFKHILYEDNYHDGRGNGSHPQYGHLANVDPLNQGPRSYSPKSSLLLNTSDGIWLRDAVDIYYEFPPIYPDVDSVRGYEWAKISRQEYLDITPDPLLTEYKKDFDIYADEASDYTWICYLKLKQEA